MASVTVRYFAAAAEAAGVEEETLPATEAGSTLGELRDLLVGRYGPAMARVVANGSFLVDGGPATVGVIASVTRSFCAACDRTRLTAEGTVRSCLFGDDETDLRGMLRDGASDAELADRWRAAMWGKQAGHGIDAASFTPPARSMGAIGG